MADPRSCSGTMSATKAAGAGPLIPVPMAENSRPAVNSSTVGAKAEATTPIAAR